MQGKDKYNFRRVFAVILVAALAVAAATAVSFSRWSENPPAPLISSEDVTQPFPQDSAFEVRYIANEGVMISSRDKRVLIDGLHRKYEDAYAYLPDSEREKIESSSVPFDKIDLVLVSHMHGDHFHPESVGRYLTANPKTVFASSGQVVDLLAGKFAGYEAVKSRIFPIVFRLKDRQPMKLAGIDVEFLGVGHGSGRHASIQNLGHVITLNGKKFLHVGDSDGSPEIFDAFDLEQRSIDVALLPYWFLIDKQGKELVERHIRPKQIFALHVGPAESETVVSQVKANFPDAHVFTTMLEKRNL